MKTHLLAQIDRYSQATGHDSHQQEMVSRFRDLLNQPAPWLRDGFEPGHLTGAALITSPCRKFVLLTHHRKLDLWLQVGGHWEEGDPTLQATALREAFEESGLESLSWVDGGEILDLDVHSIPARKSEPGHLHYDVRYTLEGDPKMPPKLSAESVEVRWFSLPEARQLVKEESLLRLFDKISS